jgi:hypothetical protein
MVRERPRVTALTPQPSSLECTVVLPWPTVLADLEAQRHARHAATPAWCPQCHQDTCTPFAQTGRVCLRCGYCERPQPATRGENR